MIRLYPKMIKFDPKMIKLYSKMIKFDPKMIKVLVSTEIGFILCYEGICNIGGPVKTTIPIRCKKY